MMHRKYTHNGSNIALTNLSEKLMQSRLLLFTPLAVNVLAFTLGNGFGYIFNFSIYLYFIKVTIK